MTAAPVILSQLSALTDPTRARLLGVLGSHELTVTELVAVTQLPQSSVSRHLRVLADQGWVHFRVAGTSRWYRLDRNDLDSAAQAVWATIRDSLAASPAARQDGRRLEEVLRARRTRSREFFSTAAARWDRLREELYGPRASTPALAAFLDPAWTIGDLGCGTGEMTAALAPFVARVIAVDAEQEMLDAASVRLADEPRVEFRLGDLEALPLEDASLDAAIIALVLHHVADPASVLRQARRVLRPGAPLVVVDMVPHDREEYRDEMGHQWLGFSERDMRRLLADAGYQQETLRYHPLPTDPRAKGPSLFVAAGRAGGRPAPGRPHDPSMMSPNPAHGHSSGMPDLPKPRTTP
jgi:ArsR family transcriptional regulator